MTQKLFERHYIKLTLKWKNNVVSILYLFRILKVDDINKKSLNLARV